MPAPPRTVAIQPAQSSACRLHAMDVRDYGAGHHGPQATKPAGHRPTRPPGGQRGEPLAEADVPDVPLLLVDGYALPVTVR